jgi:hypothetical protein
MVEPRTPGRSETTAQNGETPSAGVQLSPWQPVEARERAIELVLPVELIIAEAKRWEIADDVALQVLPTGRVNVLWRSVRAGEFVDHLLGLQAAGRFAGRR